MSAHEPDRSAARVALAYEERERRATRGGLRRLWPVSPKPSCRAREAGVYVHGSPALVNLLMQVDMDSQIPPQLYAAVAELPAWLHHVEQPPPAP